MKNLGMRLTGFIWKKCCSLDLSEDVW